MQSQSYWEKIKVPSQFDQYRLNADQLAVMIYQRNKEFRIKLLIINSFE